MVSFSLWIIFRQKKLTLVSPGGNGTAEAVIPTIPTIAPEKAMGILLLGYGGAGHDGGWLTDAIQLLYVDNERQTTALISIPRDLLVQSAAGQSKINAVMVQNATDKDELLKSGMMALKQVVSQFTGLPVNYFLAVDFVGIQRVIGGEFGNKLDVQVHETLDDPWYPVKGNELETCGLTAEQIADYSAKYSGFELEKQFPCRYEHLHFDPGLTGMEGEDVLKYARSRHGSAEGDVSRGKRQQEVINAIAKNTFSIKTIEQLPDFFKQLASNLQTDVDKDIVAALLPMITKAKDYKQITVNLGPANILQSSTHPSAGYVMIPKTGSFDWDSVHKFLKEELSKN